VLLRYLADAFRSGIRTAAKTMYRTARFRSSPAPLGPATPGARVFSPVQSTPTPFPIFHERETCCLVCVRGRRTGSHLICPCGITLSGLSLKGTQSVWPEWIPLVLPCLNPDQEDY